MTEQEQFLRGAMERQGSTVYRLALCRLQSREDAEDVYQDVFLHLLSQGGRDWDEEHLKAWLIRATLNRCADLHRFRLRRPVLALEELPELAAADRTAEASELWEAVARLRRSYAQRCTSTTPRAAGRRRSPGSQESRRLRSAPGCAGLGSN